MELNKIYKGDNLEILKTFPDNSIDSIVTDPPYGLGKEPNVLEVLQSWITTGYYEIKGKGFMGKDWDAFVPQPIFWKECLRVLKPGGYLLSFAGTRTYDWVVIGLRIAGFEIRDQIAWLYGTGFPKSHDINKAIDKSSSEQTKKWQGWGTALKPALEPIVMARKPLQGTIGQNILKYGVGGINIDSCRIETRLFGGRWPTNVIHDGSEEVMNLFPKTKTESVARFFYVPKASQNERNFGLSGFEDKVTTDGRNKPVNNAFNRGKTKRKNIHPTVKPLELMKYLVRLVTPDGGICLDPFLGSGTTAIACKLEKFYYIGIEREEDYIKIAQARIDAQVKKHAIFDFIDKRQKEE